MWDVTLWSEREHNVRRTLGVAEKFQKDSPRTTMRRKLYVRVVVCVPNHTAKHCTRYSRKQQDQHWHVNSLSQCLRLSISNTILKAIENPVDSNEFLPPLCIDLDWMTRLEMNGMGIDLRGAFLVLSRSRNKMLSSVLSPRTVLYSSIYTVYDSAVRAVVWATFVMGGRATDRGGFQNVRKNRLIFRAITIEKIVLQELIVPKTSNRSRCVKWNKLLFNVLIGNCSFSFISSWFMHS